MLLLFLTIVRTDASTSHAVFDETFSTFTENTGETYSSIQKEFSIIGEDVQETSRGLLESVSLKIHSRYFHSQSFLLTSSFRNHFLVPPRIRINLKLSQLRLSLLPQLKI